jgi:hypothetical protein
MSQFKMPIVSLPARYFVVPAKFAFGPSLDTDELRPHATVEEAIESAVGAAAQYPRADFMVIEVIGTILADAEVAER